MPFKDKEKKRSYELSYRKTNQERIKEQRRQYSLKNREQFLEKKREYSKRNAEKSKLTYKKNWNVNIIREIRRRSKGIFDVDSEFLLELFNKQEGKCYWFGIELITDSIVKHPLQPSVDRLDNSKGYIRNNVVISSLIANFSRNDFDQSLWQDAIDKIRNF